MALDTQLKGVRARVADVKARAAAAAVGVGIVTSSHQVAHPGGAAVDHTNSRDARSARSAGRAGAHGTKAQGCGDGRPPREAAHHAGGGGRGGDRGGGGGIGGGGGRGGGKGGGRGGGGGREGGRDGDSKRCDECGFVAPRSKYSKKQWHRPKGICR
jgi:hypothetical protein